MKIISGGQTGADFGALRAAKELGISTGGYCPKGFRTENGPNPNLKDFGLIETDRYDYYERTYKNILMSDCTIIISKNLDSAGTKLTRKLCRKLNKEYIIISDLNGLSYKELGTILWLKLKDSNCKIINVAGNRESVSQGIEDFAYNIIKELCVAFKKII